MDDIKRCVTREKYIQTETERQRESLRRVSSKGLKAGRLILNDGYFLKFNVDAKCRDVYIVMFFCEFNSQYRVTVSSRYVCNTVWNISVEDILNRSFTLDYLCEEQVDNIGQQFFTKLMLLK